MFFLGGVGLYRLDLMIRNLHVYFRLEAKCSALSYKTPLGTGRNGSERRLFAMKKHTIHVFLLLIVYTMWRGGRGAAFSCPIALDR